MSNGKGFRINKEELELYKKQIEEEEKKNQAERQLEKKKMQ